MTWCLGLHLTILIAAFADNCAPSYPVGKIVVSELPVVKLAFPVIFIIFKDSRRGIIGAILS